MLNSNISSRCFHNMANFDPLAAEISSGVLGTPANFKGFRVLASLLQRRRSPEANQTLQDVWPSPGLVHYTYIFAGSCRLTEFCQVQNSRYVQVLRSPILAALLQGTLAAGVDQTLRLGTRNGITELSQRAPPIYSAGRPSRLASAHILVFAIILSNTALFMAPYGIGQAIIFLPAVSFFFLSFFFIPRLISTATDWTSTILLHMVWP